MRLMLTAVVALVIVGHAGADDKQAFTKAKPPHFVVVGAVDPEKGTLSVVVSVEKPVPTTVFEEVEENGKKVQKQKVVFNIVREFKFLSKSLNSLRIETAGGKVVTGADELKALVGKTVLMATDSDGVAPIFLALLSKDAVVITPTAADKPSQK